MAENRTQTRMHVVWNGAIRLPSLHIVQIKVLNVTEAGLQFSCSENLQAGRKYEMQMHVPDLNGLANTTIVPCFAECLYVILSGNEFRIGAKFSGLSKQNNDLIQKWSERCARGVA